MYCTVQPYSLVLNILSVAFTHSLTFMYCTVQPYSLVLNILCVAFTHSLTFMLPLNAVHAPAEGGGKISQVEREKGPHTRLGLRLRSEHQDVPKDPKRNPLYF